MIDPFTQKGIVLQSGNVECRIMSPADVSGLRDAARPPAIWEHMIFDASDPVEFSRYIESMLGGYERREHVPFTIFDKDTGKVAGAIKLMRISIPDACLTLGGTWINPSFWGTGTSREMHRAILGHVFDTLNVNRTEVRVHTSNLRSLKAMPKLGLTYEGTLRASATARSGTRNDVAYFSMLASEWSVATINPRNAPASLHQPSAAFDIRIVRQ
ncbi:GNAT family N-acetyltransferase [Rhizobium terrae]|uniref:GNAT family N-acetyltransferase n=1 Tax=Rhizobium terrae TaxID=2171756 RepID=UPI000E3D247C|nr:GNAT family protein [Rhizobium terrae]